VSARPEVIQWACVSREVKVENCNLGDDVTFVGSMGVGQVRCPELLLPFERKIPRFLLSLSKEFTTLLIFSGVLVGVMCLLFFFWAYFSRQGVL